MDEKKVTEETQEKRREEAGAETAATEETSVEAETPEEPAAEAESSEETAAEAEATEEASVEAETSEEPAEEAESSEETAEEAASEEASAETENSEEAAAETETPAPEEEVSEEPAESEEASEVAAEEETAAAEEEPPIIKKKKKLDKTNIIVITVAAVVVIACLVFVGFKVGWFKIPQTAKQTVQDYGTIEVLKEDVEVSDEIVHQYISNILQSQTQTNEVEEGVVQDGDQLNIDFVGKLDETGEEFQGGSAKGRTLTIGSGTMVDGFESSLVGAKIGEKTTIHVTFPEDYGDKELAGKAATFDVTINSKNETVVPELTDDFVQAYSMNYLERPLSTVKDLEEYVKNYLYNYYLHSAMFEELIKKQTVEAYDEEKEAMLIQYSLDALDYYAAMYGTTVDQYAAAYGASSAQEYAENEAHQYLKSIMLIDQIIKDKNVTWTDDDFRQSVALYMARNGYSERYTVDEFLEASGETWKYLYENLEFKYDLALKALENNVVFVDEKTTTDESIPAQESGESSEQQSQAAPEQESAAK